MILFHYDPWKLSIISDPKYWVRAITHLGNQRLAFQNYIVFLLMNTIFILRKREDPGVLMYFVEASHHGLHCLPKCLFMNFLVCVSMAYIHALAVNSFLKYLRESVNTRH